MCHTPAARLGDLGDLVVRERVAGGVAVGIRGGEGAIIYGTVPSQSDADFDNNFTTLYSRIRSVDANDRVTEERVKDASSATQEYTQYSYYANEQLECVATRMNPATFGSPPLDVCALGTQGSYGPDRITEYDYDAAGRPFHTYEGVGTGAQRTLQTLQYTPNGRLHYLTDGNGNSTTLAYDGMDRLQYVYFPSPTSPGQSSTTDYVQNTYNETTWNVGSVRLRDGTIVSNDYDWRHNMVATTSPTTQNYTYDNLDRPITLSGGGLTLTETYDALGRLTSDQNSVLGAVTSVYDNAGRRTKVTYPDGYFATFYYDNAGALLTSKESDVTTLLTNNYDNDNRLSTIMRYDGVTTTYHYDPNRDPLLRLTGITHTYPGSASGNSVTVNLGSGATGPTYDPSGGLTGRTLSNQAYAWSGSKPPTSYTVDGQNKITAAGGTNFLYNGNADLTNDGTRTYAYDEAGQLITAGPVSLYYDPLGRLWKTVDGATTTDLVYDGQEVASEYDGNLNEQKRYVHNQGLDQPMVIYESGTAHYPLADERGSVMGVADNSGNMLAINTYDEYGLPGASNYGRFQYTGQAWVPDAGVYNYKARDYNPTWGRFLQPDPIGYAGGMNLYAYVGEDPIDFADASGNDPCDGPNPPSDCIGGITITASPKSPDDKIDPVERVVTGATYKPTPAFIILNNTPVPIPNLSCHIRATFTAVGPNQAKAKGALYSAYPKAAGGSILGGTFGTVAVQRGFLGLSTRQLRMYGAQISITPGNQALIQETGGPTGPLTVSDYGDANIQATPGYAFDIYRFPTDEDALTFGRRSMSATISFPAGVPAHC